MIKEDLWKPKRRKKTKWRSKRVHKAHFGEMFKFDGSLYHLWFEERAPKCCLLAAIEDATSIVTHAQFAENEGTIPVFLFWTQYLLLRRKPLSVYLDKLRTYTNNGVLEGERKESSFSCLFETK